jgi:sugar transferase (PEP-CTERM/EpsH1 system associated)
VRPHNWIRHLAQRGHRVTLLTVCTSDGDHQALEGLHEYCDRILPVNLPAWRSVINCLLALPSRKPLQAVYSWDPVLADNLFQLATNTIGSSSYDIVHLEHLRGSQYGVNLISRPADKKSPLPIVWDSVDSISLLFRQAMVRSKSFLSRELTRFELGRTERYEGWLVGQFDRVLVTSENDKQSLLSLRNQVDRESRIDVLPNGVDLAYFTPGKFEDREEQTIVLSGKMSYHANISMVVGFMEEIMPLVWEVQPDVQVWIVGKDPPQRLQAYDQNRNVQVTGTVDDLRPYLKRATISASPLNYGAGIQNKVLEAMACATPVIASKQAVSALDVQIGEEIVVAEEPHDFAGKLIEFLGNPEKRERIGRSGRRFVEENHDWARTTARLEDVYTQSLNQREASEVRVAHNSPQTGSLIGIKKG